MRNSSVYGGVSWLKSHQTELGTWYDNAVFTSEISNNLEYIYTSLNEIKKETVDEILDLSSDCFYPDDIKNIDELSIEIIKEHFKNRRWRLYKEKWYIRCT